VVFEGQVLSISLFASAVSGPRGRPAMLCVAIDCLIVFLEVDHVLLNFLNVASVYRRSSVYIITLTLMLFNALP